MTQIDVQTNIGDFPRRLMRLPREVREEVLVDISEDTEEFILGQFARIVQYWRHKARFVVRAIVRPTMLRIQAGTDDDVFRYVDEGTRPHIIEPRGEGYPLRFREGYAAKTSPGVLGSRPGGPSGAYVHAWRVRHPGTRARRFSQMIGRAAIKTIRQSLGKRFGKAVQRGYQRVKL
jgi:hypothetical protein